MESKQWDSQTTDLPDEFYGPAATKTTTVNVITDVNVRCDSCQKYLAQQVTRPWIIKCHRCGSVNELLS